MKHVDDETLAMLAVAGVVPDEQVARHLEGCERCRGEVRDLQRVASVTRASADVTLETPPESVWDRITTQIRQESAAASAGRAVTADTGRPDTTDTGRHTPVEPVHPVDPVGPVGTPSRRRPAPNGPGSAPSRRRRRRIVTALVAGIGALALVFGTVTVTDAVRRATPTETVVARADLAALAGWRGASGTAELERSSDGGLSLVVDLHGDGERSGAGRLREVWMMRSDLQGLVSMGYLDGDRGRFTVPADMDLAEYPVVDVSAEPDDGNPKHSGDSIVRGDLHDAD